jgi:hypothetical protein
MPFVSGFLRLRRRGGHPDQGLPPIDELVDPGYGVDEGAEVGGGLPDHELPTPPPGIWPPLTPSHPIQPAPPGTPPGAMWPPVDPGYGVGAGRPPRPGQGLPRPPGGGGAPDQGLPRPPGGGGAPDQGLPAPGAPDQGLPGRPGLPVGPDQGLPSKTYWVIAGIPGVGWRYIAVDPSLPPVGGTLPSR